jgi:hypothetical protein
MGSVKIQVRGARYKAKDVRFKVQGSRFKVLGSRFKVLGFGFEPCILGPIRVDVKKTEIHQRISNDNLPQKGYLVSPFRTSQPAGTEDGNDQPEPEDAGDHIPYEGKKRKPEEFWPLVGGNDDRRSHQQGRNNEAG